NLPPIEGLHVCIRVVPQLVQITGHDTIEVAVSPEKVETVAEHEVVFDREPDEAQGHGHDAAHRLVQQGADFDALRVSSSQLAQHIGDREPGVNDVLDQHDISPADVHLKVLDDSDPSRALLVGGDGEEVDLDRNAHGSDQIGKKGHTALED